MSKQKILTAVALATALVSGSSLALAAPTTAAAAATTAAPSSAAMHDFAKMSTQGHAAYADLTQARFAIFNGHPERASKLIGQASQALQKANKDNTAFTAAESDLHMAPSSPEQQATAPKDATPLSWLPVDGQMLVADDYVATPAKKAAVAEANSHLKKGDRAAAMNSLKLADVDVTYTAALLPLKQTVSSVKEADGLLTAQKYYEANQVLNKVQSSVRVVIMDDNMQPKTSAKK